MLFHALRFSLRKSLKWLSFAMVLLCVVLGLLVASMATLIYVVHRSGQLQTWVSQQVGLSVNFERATLHWQGVQPELMLEDLTIKAQPTAKASFKIHQLLVAFNLWQSLYQTKLVTRRIILRGTQLELVQQPNGQITLVGAPDSAAKAGALANFWQWLQPQSHIQLVDVSVTLQRPQGNIVVRHLNAQWYRSAPNQYALTVGALLPQVQDGYGSVQAQIQMVNGLPNVQLYANLAGQNVVALWPGLAWQHLQVKSIGGNSEWWANWQQGRLQSVTGRVWLQPSVLVNSATSTTATVPAIKGQLQWTPNSAGGWQLTIEPLQPITGALPPLSTYAQVTVTPQTGGAMRWQVQAAGVDLSGLGDLAGVVANPSWPWLTGIALSNPEGEIRHLYAQWQMKNKTLHDAVLDTTVVLNQTQPWQDWPGMGGLTVHVHATSTWGLAQLSADDFTVSQPEWFNAPWPASTVQAQFWWQKTAHGWRLDIPFFESTNPWLAIWAHGHVVWPEQGSTPVISLLGAYSVQHAEAVTQNYVPNPPILNKIAGDWLRENLQAVPEADGAFVVRGPLNQLPFAQHQGILQLTVATHNATVIPWFGFGPVTQVDSHLLLNNQQMLITADHGVIVGGQLQSFDFWLPELGDVDTHYEIRGQAKVDSAMATPYLVHSPLNDDLGQLLHSVALQGPMTVGVNIDIPVGPANINKPALIQGMVHLHHDEATVKGTPIRAKQLAGTIHFRDADVWSNPIQGSLWGQPLWISLATHSPSLRGVTILGMLDLDALQRVTGWHADGLTGRSPFTATIAITPDTTLLTFKSSLQGIASYWPAPFFKPQTEVWPFTVKLDLGHAEQWPVALQLGSVVNAQLLVQAGTGDQQLPTVRGTINLGSTLSNPPSYTPHQPGVLLTGHIAALPLSDWIEVLQKLTAGGAPSMSPVQLTEWLQGADLQVDHLTLGNQQFPNALLNFSWQAPAWQVRISGPKAAGVLVLPSNYAKPSYQAQFDYLFLQRSASSGPVNDRQLVKTMFGWPALNIAIQKLYWGDANLGSLQWVSVPTQHGIAIQTLKVQSPNFSATVSGSIVKRPENNSFNFSGEVDAQDWGQTLSDLGFAGVMQSGKGLIQFNGSWDGQLFAPEAPTINGRITFNLTNGELTKINPGFSRFLGLFSVGSLARRLSLNFSDVTQNGLAFDTLVGEYTIREGVADTKSVHITGPALDMLMKGQIDLVHQTLDQIVVVMPQVGGGLALAAGLIGGPLVGVATWFADKIVTSTLMKNRGLVYQVTGPWDNPDVKNILSQGASS